MIKYKLTDQNLQTHKGHQWTQGVEQVITKPGNTLCSDEVFHFYDSPEEAALYNPIHADIDNPILWEVECDQVVHDGTKGGAKRMTLVKQASLPAISIDQRVQIAIRCVKLVYKEQKWNTWADNWLSGKDRSEKSAAWAAEAMERAAAEGEIKRIIMKECLNVK